MIVSTIVLKFPPPGPPISMNEGDTWAVRKRSAAWRDRAMWAWIAEHPGKGPAGRAFPDPGVVEVELPFATNRRRDAINYAKTVKHIVDGLVLGGAWPDDTGQYVTQCVPVLGLAGGDPAVTVTVTTRLNHRSQP